MKYILTFLLSILTGITFSQEVPEKEITTKINEVTVYIEGAQITRNKTIDLPKGTSILKFTGLSPFIDAKSIQVKANGELTILTMNHEINYLEKIEKSEELTKLENQLEEVKDKITLEQTSLSVLDEELSFLQENKSIGGENQTLTVTDLKETSEFYSSRVSEIMLEKIKHKKNIQDLNKKSDDLRSQISSISNTRDFGSGEIIVKVEAKNNTQADFNISYLVSNASWFPTYDVRSKTINDPIELVYKANIKQDTKIDWVDVKLKISSSNPTNSETAPALKTYFLGYNTQPPVYDKTINTVSGKVYLDYEPLAGATVVVKGTTIGAVTDVDGSYSLSIPENASYLDFSFVGCVPQTKPINSDIINVTMEEEAIALEEVVAVGYGGAMDYEFGDDFILYEVEAEANAASHIEINKNIRGSNSIPIESTQIANQTTIDFDIQTPYTIKSENKSFSIDMVSYNIPASYQYYSIPKINNNAYLLANITNWEQYNLMEGEANIFFEDTYIGKTVVDTRYIADTLQLSLGIDKNVTVNREKLKDYREKQFIGNKQEETKDWELTVKNNKNQEISLLLLDQVPVSTLKEIEVKIEDISKGIFDEYTGEVKWELEIAPGEKKDIRLKYSVTYPQNRNVLVE